MEESCQFRRIKNIEQNIYIYIYIYVYVCVCVCVCVWGEHLTEIIKRWKKSNTGVEFTRLMTHPFILNIYRFIYCIHYILISFSSYPFLFSYLSSYHSRVIYISFTDFILITHTLILIYIYIYEVGLKCSYYHVINTDDDFFRKLDTSTATSMEEVRGTQRGLCKNKPHLARLHKGVWSASIYIYIYYSVYIYIYI